MKEAALLRAVVDALRLRGHWPIRLNAGLIVLPGGRAVRGVEPGTPDLMVLLPAGRVAWLELKAPKGKVTALQAKWHDRAAARGHSVAVVRSVAEALCAVEDAAEP